MELQAAGTNAKIEGEIGSAECPIPNFIQVGNTRWRPLKSFTKFELFERVPASEKETKSSLFFPS
jgi:hypothetical protein